jgi:hypothetical protein
VRENDLTQNNWTACEGSAFTQAISQAKSSSAQGSHSYKRALFDAHTAAREGQETSVRPIWLAGEDRDDQGPKWKQLGTAT